MNPNTIKDNIQDTLRTFAQHRLRQAATTLLNTLGYQSKRTGNDSIDSDRFQRLKTAAAETANPSQKLRIDHWQTFHLLFQITDEEINQQTTLQQTLFETTAIDDVLMKSYMFVALQLADANYTRTQLADITRFINKQIPQPIMVIFRYADVLTLAIINRRLHKQDGTKQVLEKVTLIKDINLTAPKRAHIDILAELHPHRLMAIENVRNFDTLHKAWEAILNTEALSRRFYRDLKSWYDYAKTTCRFPDSNNEMQVIRLITRLLFIWFLKEKGLVPEWLFEDSGQSEQVSLQNNELSEYPPLTDVKSSAELHDRKQPARTPQKL